MKKGETIDLDADVLKVDPEESVESSQKWFQTHSKVNIGLGSFSYNHFKMIFLILYYICIIIYIIKKIFEKSSSEPYVGLLNIRHVRSGRYEDCVYNYFEDFDYNESVFFCSLPKLKPRPKLDSKFFTCDSEIFFIFFSKRNIGWFFSIILRRSFKTGSHLEIHICRWFVMFFEIHL